jgi:hypothetical protein
LLLKLEKVRAGRGAATPPSRDLSALVVAGQSCSVVNGLEIVTVNNENLHVV